jgi:TDG/mug DNA glycosylase family protein
MAVLPDVLEDGLATLFCGSAAGTVSARRQAYYAGPGNKFWPTLHAVGMTDRLIVPEEYAAVLSYRIGFTDMNKTEFGADSELSRGADDAHAVLEKVRRHRPGILAFTAKRPAGVFIKAVFGRGRVDYGLQQDAIGDTRLFVLPSPSGLARRFWDETWWHALATLHDEVRGPASGPG